MRLPLFFPASVAVIAAMIWYGIKPGLANVEEMERIRSTISEDGFVIEGDSLGEAVRGARTTIDVHGPPSLRRAVMTSQGAPADAQRSHGVLYVAPPFALPVFAGRSVRVSLNARAARENGAHRALLRLDVQGHGSSGWREVEVGTEFAEVGFQFVVPESDTLDPILVLIWPDATGRGEALEVRQVMLRPVD